MSEASSRNSHKILEQNKNLPSVKICTIFGYLGQRIGQQCEEREIPLKELAIMLYRDDLSYCKDQLKTRKTSISLLL